MPRILKSDRFFPSRVHQRRRNQWMLPQDGHRFDGVRIDLQVRLFELDRGCRIVFRPRREVAVGTIKS